jgi:hypothetical protein
LTDLIKVRSLPGKEFYYLDAGKELLEKFGAPIGKNHSLLAEKKREAQEPDLDRRHHEKNSETSQSARAQVDQKDDETNDQLDWSGPTRMKELTSEVDTRDVSGDVVDQFSAGVDMASTGGECKSLVVDRGDQSCAQQHTGTQGAVVKVAHGKRRQSLKEEETKHETDTVLDWRGYLSSIVGNIRLLGKPDDSLAGM